MAPIEESNGRSELNDVPPGVCRCDCAGCDAGYGHCKNPKYGCRWGARTKGQS